SHSRPFHHDRAHLPKLLLPTRPGSPTRGGKRVPEARPSGYPRLTADYRRRSLANATTFLGKKACGRGKPGEMPWAGATGRTTIRASHGRQPGEASWPRFTLCRPRPVGERGEKGNRKKDCSDLPREQREVAMNRNRISAEPPVRLPLPPPPPV